MYDSEWYMNLHKTEQISIVTPLFGFSSLLLLLSLLSLLSIPSVLSPKQISEVLQSMIIFTSIQYV